MFKTLAHWVNKNNKDDDGAVTIDWVVITSAVAFLSISVVLVVSEGAQIYATFVNEDLVDIAYEIGFED